MDALKKAGVDFEDLRLVSVTQGPGLMGSLLAGVSFAKAISFALDIPIIGINHVVAHIWSTFLNGVKVTAKNDYWAAGLLAGYDGQFIASKNAHRNS